MAVINRNILKLFATILLLHCCWAATVDKNGGYDLTVGIRTGESLPQNPQLIIQNIQRILATFSLQLWTVTNQTFFLRRVNIIVPATWNISGAEVTSNSYPDSDIRISTHISFPSVQNPNYCGVGGDFIETPSGFWGIGDQGKFGEDWKVLLVLWARLRWGVFEEHGIPGNDKFPYFIQNGAEWAPSGCTNAENNKLVGAFKYLNGTACPSQQQSPLDPACRFYPDPTGNSGTTSSLMSFHFLDSVDYFCDEFSHQKSVPTRQNYYCDGRSVMETIRSGQDFQKVTEKFDSFTEIEFKVLTPSSQSVLYVLLDQGLRDYADAAGIKSAVTAIQQFLRDETILPHDTLVGIGKFPTQEMGPGLHQDVPIGLLKDQRAEIDSAIENYSFDTGSQNLGKALLQTAAVIQASSHKGGNILVLKTTPSKNSSFLLMEPEVQNDLRRDNIKCFAIEVLLDPATTSKELKTLANFTGADIIGLTGIETAGQEVLDFLMDVVLKGYSAEAPVLPPEERENVIWKSHVVPKTNYTIEVANLTKVLTFYLALPVRIKPTDILAGIFAGQASTRVQFNESQRSTGYIYTGALNTVSWDFLKVLFSYNGSANGSLIVTSKGVPPEKEITVDIYPSSKNVDLANIPNPETPFSVSVILKQGRAPVLGANVMAFLEYKGGVQSVFKLSDTGFLGDLEASDGTYTGICVPSQNGVYTLSVAVNKSDEVPMVLKGSNVGPWLLGPDQVVPNKTGPVQIPWGTHTTARYGSEIFVTNVEKYVPVIPRIRDLAFTVSRTAPFVITFIFATPQILVQGGQNNFPVAYQVYSASDEATLAGLNPGEPLPSGVGQKKINPSCNSPGTECDLKLGWNWNSTMYFVVVAWSSDGIFSPVSNTAMVTPPVVVTPAPTTISPTTTTAASTSTSTTTPGTTTTTTSSSTSTPTPTTSTTSTTTTTPIPATSTTKAPSTSTSTTTTTTTTSTTVTTTPLPDSSSTSTTPSASTTGGSTKIPSGGEATTEEPKPWIKTTAGIAIVATICVVGGLILLGLLIWCCWKQTRVEGDYTVDGHGRTSFERYDSPT